MSADLFVTRGTEMPGTERPRIALVCWDAAVGGAETQSHLLARELRATGIDASIVFLQHQGILTRRLDDDGVPWRALELPRGRSTLAHPQRLLAALKAQGPDGVILPDIGFLIGLLRAGGYRSPIVAVDHGSFLQSSNLSPIARLRLRATRAIAFHCEFEHVVVSDAMQESVVRHERSRRCIRIYNGVDLTSTHDPPRLHPGETLIIGAVGRVTTGKGFEPAIRSLAGQHAVLRIAGDGPDRQRLESIAEAIGVRAQVDFLGWVHDMGSFWNGCHLAVMPSLHSESFGLAAVEAMAAARPVIASQQPALIEILGTTGITVPPGDHRALASAFARVATEPGLLNQLAVSARQRAEQNFDIRHTALAYADLLRITATTRERPSPAAATAPPHSAAPAAPTSTASEAST